MAHSAMAQQISLIAQQGCTAACRVPDFYGQLRERHACLSKPLFVSCHGCKLHTVTSWLLA